MTKKEARAFVNELIKQLREEHGRIYPKHPAGLLDQAAETLELALSGTGWIGIVLEKKVVKKRKALRSKIQ